MESSRLESPWSNGILQGKADPISISRSVWELVDPFKIWSRSSGATLCSIAKKGLDLSFRGNRGRAEWTRVVGRASLHRKFPCPPTRLVGDTRIPRWFE